VKDLGLKEHSVASTVSLLEGGATILLSRATGREKTGSLDEIAIRSIARNSNIILSLKEGRDCVQDYREPGKAHAGTSGKIEECTDKNMLEDLYLPYKPKKRTRATIAIEKGLLPLAEIIFAQENLASTKNEIVARFVNPEKGVNSHEEAISGAIDIVAEMVSDDSYIRGWIRTK